MPSLPSKLGVVAFVAAVAICQFAVAEEMANGFQFFDPELQSQFAKKLTEARIPHQIRADGAIAYPSQYEERVSAIRLAVLGDSYTPNIHFTDPQIEQRFLDRLRSERIEFGVKVKDSKRWITWSERDDKRVVDIYRSILHPR
jgi:hypothetical protein